MTEISGIPVVLEEGEEEISPWLYVGEIIVVVVLSLAFHITQHTVRHHFHETGRSELVRVIDTLFAELMVLGFIGLLVFVFTKTGITNHMTAAIFNVPVPKGEDPLSESFEKIHMIIFAVMMVFITQASMLMYQAQKIGHTWMQFEMTLADHPRPTKTGEILPSAKELLVKTGYLDTAGRDLKQMHVERQGIGSLFSSEDFSTGKHGVKYVKELVQYRAILQEFLYPHSQGEDNKNFASSVVVVSEPHLVRFYEYLSDRLGEAFCELIEVDFNTWAFAFLVSPMIKPLLDLDTTAQLATCLCLGLLHFSLILLLSHHIFEVFYYITPHIEIDPQEVLGILRGARGKFRNPHNRRATAPDMAPEYLVMNQHTDGRGLATALSETVDAYENQANRVQRQGTNVTNETSGDTNQRKKSVVQNEHPIIRKPARFRHVQEEAKYIYHKVCDCFTAVIPAKWKDFLCDRKGNCHEKLFWFGRHGPEFIDWMLECLMFFQAVFCAGLLTALVNDCGGDVFASSWTGLQWGLWLCCWICPIVNVNYVTPIMMSRYTMVCSVEHMKDSESLHKNIQRNKKRSLWDAVQLLHLIKTHNRVKDIEGGTVTQEEFTKYLLHHARLSTEKREYVDELFCHFDVEEPFGCIEKTEFAETLAHTGDKADDMNQIADGLLKMVDVQNQGLVTRDSFRVLMLMAVYRSSPEQARADSDDFFKMFDADDSGDISTTEMCDKLNQMGVAMSQRDVEKMLQQCFHGQFKAELTPDDFFHFMEFLESFVKM